MISTLLATKSPLSNDYSPATPLAAGWGGTYISRYSELLNPLIKSIPILLGVTGLFYLIFAGYQYLTSGGDKGKIQQSTSAITNVIIGLILTSSAYLLLTIVGKIINFEFFNPFP